MFKFITVLIFTCTLNFAFAQQQYTWDMYNLSFTLADDFRETANDEEEFSATGDGMEFSIIPFNDASIDEDDITTFTMSIAASLDLDYIQDLDVIELNGFTGAYAEAEVEESTIFIMGLIDPDSESNFFVLLEFGSDDENAIEEAVNICLSIKRNNS